MFISKEVYLDRITKRILKRQKAIKRYWAKSEARALRKIRRHLNNGKCDTTVRNLYLSREALDRIVNIIETQYPYLELKWNDPDFYDHCEYTFTATVKEESKDE